MRRYSRIHFPEPQQNAVQIPNTGSSAKHELRRKTYPNAILLVTSWDSIQEDAHNDPEHFTSPIGKTMLTLSVSNLVDFERPNVIVVVTRSLSFWQDYEDEEDEDEKKRHWCDDARKRTGIIGALQRKVFPCLRSWRVVFVENGGGHPLLKKHRTLPNGELSHQNVFEAIHDLFTATDDGDMPKDLVGMHALPLLTGADSLGSLFEQRQVEILCELKPSETIPEQERLSIVSVFANCCFRFLTNLIN
jgi:tetratricopeptide (TPR) repeat protein